MPNIDEMWQGTRDAITVKRVYGEPVERDGVTFIPAAVVSGAAGGGGDSGGDGGGGFAVRARPVGAYVIRDGSASWRPTVDLNRLLVLAAVLVFLIARRT